MKAFIDKAEVLIEALPYMRRFLDKTIVIKYGGSAMSDDGLRASFAVDVVLLKHIGLKPVIVHGGGPQIGATLERLGKKSTFIDGLRVTDDETMEVVEMVLGGKVNREIVSLIQQGGGRAVGMTGSDGDMIRVTAASGRRPRPGSGGARVVAVDPSAIADVAAAGYVPVIAPIGVDDAGVTHNVNADEAAGAVAAALRAEKLILLTDVEGVKDAAGERISQLSCRGSPEADLGGRDSRRHDPEGEVLHQRARAGRRPHSHRRWARAARGAAGDLHGQRRRHAAGTVSEACPRTFVSIADWPAEELWGMLDRARELKQLDRAGASGRRPCRGACWPCSSRSRRLRTHVTFEAGMTQLGGNAILLRPEQVGIGTRESAADVARNLSRWVDGMVARTFSHTRGRGAGRGGERSR